MADSGRRHVGSPGRAGWLRTPLLAVVMIAGVAGCGTGSSDDVSASESSRPSAEESAPSGAALTPAGFCGLLSDIDLRALQQPPVGKPPTPVDKDGLPGCDWSLGEPGRHLEMSVFTAPDPELISQTATSTFPVGSIGTGYISFGSVVGGCNALVRTPDAPAAQFLRYTLESLDGSVTSCDKASRRC